MRAGHTKQGMAEQLVVAEDLLARMMNDSWHMRHTT